MNSNFKKEECKIYFNGKMVQMDEEGKVNRFPNVSEGWGYGDGTHLNAVTFIASQSINITGFGIFTCEEDDGELKARSLKLVKGNTTAGECLYEEKEVPIVPDPKYS